MICFQILSLTTFLQDDLQSSLKSLCCDLLSNFIFDNVLTSIFLEYLQRIKLWFAFKFYLWQRSYKLSKSLPDGKTVVICFQILSLTTFLQAVVANQYAITSCDLLSNFIFDNVLTRFNRSTYAHFHVVICFQILSLTTFLQGNHRIWCRHKVVICFQILSLTTFLQEYKRYMELCACCDLLSNFIFDNVLTRHLQMLLYFFLLWFAFKFYLWQRSYKVEAFTHSTVYVVICFQILSLTTFLQAYRCTHWTFVGCDLLSNFIFDNVLTRINPV